MTSLVSCNQMQLTYLFSNAPCFSPVGRPIKTWCGHQEASVPSTRQLFLFGCRCSAYKAHDCRWRCRLGNRSHTSCSPLASRNPCAFALAVGPAALLVALVAKPIQHHCIARLVACKRALLCTPVHAKARRPMTFTDVFDHIFLSRNT
jgi:hypothetical protein